MGDERRCESEDEFPDEHARRSASMVEASMDEDGAVVAMSIIV